MFLGWFILSCVLESDYYKGVPPPKKTKKIERALTATVFAHIPNSRQTTPSRPRRPLRRHPIYLVKTQFPRQACFFGCKKQSVSRDHHRVSLFHKSVSQSSQRCFSTSLTLSTFYTAPNKHGSMGKKLRTLEVIHSM